MCSRVVRAHTRVAVHTGRHAAVFVRVMHGHGHLGMGMGMGMHEYRMLWSLGFSFTLDW